MSTTTTTTTTTESAVATKPRRLLDIEGIRRDFPILARQVNGHPLAYLDNAASAQRPNQVLEAMDRCYHEFYANVHRGVHELSQRSSQAYEEARARVARHLRCQTEEVVFVRGTTEAINLVAQSYGRTVLGTGDRILITQMEHHSNIVPWQLLCAERGAHLDVAPVDESGEVVLSEYRDLLGPRTKIVGLSHVSNSLGTINPIAEMTRQAHQVGARVVVDGAQAVPHIGVDLASLDCDFYAFSAHKAFGPSGVGVLMGKAELLRDMPPWQGGGGMIERVRVPQGTTFAPPPHRFEAGTPNIVGAIGTAAALDYIDEIGLESFERWEDCLVEIVRAGLAAIPGVRILGDASERVSVVSFLVEGAHTHDVGQILDQDGIAVRTGHHCNQPLMERFGVDGTTRASFAFYNTEEEAHRLVAGVRKAQEFFN